MIARDYGFASWPNLKEHADFFTLTPIEQLVAALCAQNADRVAQLPKDHPELKGHLDEPFHYGDLPILLAAVQRTDRKTIDVLFGDVLFGVGTDIHTRGKSWDGGQGVLDECHPDLASFLMQRGAVIDAHSAARQGVGGASPHSALPVPSGGGIL